jgi:hypothetical protein
MFDDLDATLMAVLTDPAAPEALRNAAVAFQTPDKDFAPSVATMDLFLMQVNENHDLRNGAPISTVSTDTGRHTTTDPPLRVDCTYVLTTWSPKTTDLKVKEEHQLLGAAMAWIHRFPVLPQRFRVGVLATQIQPVLLRVGNPEPEGAFAHVWTALGIAPRPMLSLTATVPMPVGDSVDDTFPPVAQILLTEGTQGDWALRGRVVDDGGAPIPGALVTLVETGDRTTSDAAGAFAFLGIAFGDYTLRVRAAGRAPGPPSTVRYGPTSETHQIVLTPM